MHSHLLILVDKSENEEVDFPDEVLVLDATLDKQMAKYLESCSEMFLENLENSVPFSTEENNNSTFFETVIGKVPEVVFVSTSRE